MRSSILNAFSVDVEDYFRVAALASAIPRDSWTRRESRVERDREALPNERGFRRTFFVLGRIAERHPGLIKRIAAAGHEVASRGFSHQLIYTQFPAEFREETVRSKRPLEDLIGAAVIGYRAASFSIMQRSLWALDVLIDLGFLYDSLIFPIRHDRYGIPGASPEPGKIAGPSGRAVAEFPMSTATFLGMKLPVSRGGYFRLLSYRMSLRGLTQINRTHGRPFTFHLHPWEVDPGQPRVRVGWLSRFRHYTNLDRCEPRLRRLLAEFRFGTMRDVLRARGLLGEPASATTAAVPADA